MSIFMQPSNANRWHCNGCKTFNSNNTNKCAWCGKPKPAPEPEPQDAPAAQPPPDELQIEKSELITKLDQLTLQDIKDLNKAVDRIYLDT